MPESVLWIVVGALCGWLGKAQLERFKVTEAYRTEQAKRRVDAQVAVWQRLDLSLFYTSYYLESLVSYEPGDEVARERLNARSRKAKEAHDAFEIALQERRLVLGGDYKRLIGIQNRMADLDGIAMSRPIDITKMREHFKAIEKDRDDLASIVRRSLRW